MKKIFLVLLLIITANSSYPQGSEFYKINEMMLNGDYKSAISELELIVENDSANMQALMKLAHSYSASYKYQKAAAVLQKALVEEPGSAKILYSLGNAYMALDQYSDAKAAFENALIEMPGFQSALLNLGQVHIALKEWNEAKNIFAILIEEDESAVYFYEQLARCNEALKEYDEALINYQVANRLNPKNLNTILKLGSIYLKTERPVSAQRIADAGIKLYPQLSDLWRMKAEAHFKSEEFNEASFSYKKVIELGDAPANVYRNLGISLYSLDKFDLSILYLDSALIKNNKDIVTALYLGVAYKEINNLDKAENIY